MKSPYSNEVREFTIEKGCPWYEAQQTYGAPNVNWCEPTVCSIINEPANTWSNLGYIIVGLVLLKKLKKSPISWFSYTVIFMGAASFIYHATNNYLTQFIDFVGMFVMMSFLLAFNSQRVLKNKKLNFFALYWFFVALNTIIFMVFDIMDLAVQKIMLMNTIPIVILDLTAGYNEGTLKKYKHFALGLTCLGIAQAFALLDIQRIWCEPSNTFFHGHVMWHLIGSLGMGFVGLHLRDLTTNK